MWLLPMPFIIHGLDFGRVDLVYYLSLTFDFSLASFHNLIVYELGGLRL